MSAYDQGLQTWPLVIVERASKPALAEGCWHLPSSLDEFDVLLGQFIDELSDLDAACLGAGGEVVLDMRRGRRAG